MSEKWGLSHRNPEKIDRAIHILFVEKRGPIIYLAALKKGAIWHAHPYYAIYRKLPPPPPPPTPRTDRRSVGRPDRRATDKLIVHNKAPEHRRAHQKHQS